MRIPVIPYFNMNSKDLVNLAEFVCSLGIGSINLLPYNIFGLSKCFNLGREYKYSSLKSLKYEDIEPFKKEIEHKTGAKVKILG